MKKKHRLILSELHAIMNELGNTLDGTATHRDKYVDRQRANRIAAKVIFGVLVDNDQNPYQKEDWEQAEEALMQLKDLLNKEYPDIHGKR